MSRRRPAGALRPVLAAVAGVLLAVALGPSGTGAAGAAPPASPSPARQADAPAADEPGAEEEVGPFDRLASCVGAGGRLLVVLLVDESASLRSTDPDDQRVVAARAALRSIDLLRGTDGGGSSVAVDVLVSTFSFDFATVGDWSPLTADTRAEIDDRIAALASRDRSKDTDFHNALDGARRALADRATATTEGGGAGVCKAILLFTDGSYTLGVRGTAEERERFGTTKPYAPDIMLDSEEAAQEATRQGVRALCREGGVADQVRADGVALVSVPLGEGSGLLEAMTTGRAGERECGDPEPDVPGAYLPAADVDELLRTFDLVASQIAGGSPVGEPSRPVPCADEPCDEGAVPFVVSPSLRRVHVFVSVPGTGTRIVLEPPEGDPLELAPGDDQEEEVAGVPVAARWIAERAATIDLEVPDGGAGAGEWRVVLVGRDGDAPGLVQVVTFSDLLARLVGEGTRLALDAEGTLTAAITTPEGDEPTEALREPTVTATVSDPITGDTTSVPLVAGEDGFTAAYTVPPDVTASALRVALRMRATTAQGATLSSVSPEVDVAVRRPPTYPRLAPTALELTSVEGTGAAEGVLLLSPPEEGEGCAWVEDLTVERAPPGAGALALAVEGAGRSDGACSAVEGPVEVAVSVEVDERASGTVQGHIRVVLATGSGDAPIPTDVPVSFEMARGVDEAKRLALAAGLMFAGLAGPLLLLVLINLLTTRFQDLGHVRGARVPVAVTSDGRVQRHGEGRYGSLLTEADLVPLEGLGSRRRFTWGGLLFRARPPLNPFGDPYATVAPEEGTADVSREGRRTDLALGLAGSWLFLLDPDATRSGPEGEVRGVLVAFVAEGSGDAQVHRIVDDVQRQGPATARRLAELAGLGDRVSEARAR